MGPTHEIYLEIYCAMKNSCRLDRSVFMGGNDIPKVLVYVSLMDCIYV